jgi:hypothetical protein
MGFLPAAEARGVLPLVFKLPGGVEQMHWLRPMVIDIPRAGRITIDGRLDDWPAASRMDSRYFATRSLHLPVEAYLAHAPEGLYIAARLAVQKLAPADPERPGDGTSLELFLDTAGPDARAWSSTTHRFWFCPVQEDGRWRLGAWQGRDDAGQATILDDGRCQTAIRVDRDSTIFEAFIPAATLGAGPEAAWRALLSLRVHDEQHPAEGAWPGPRSAIIDTPARWGLLRFAP